MKRRLLLFIALAMLCSVAVHWWLVSPPAPHKDDSGEGAEGRFARDTADDGRPPVTSQSTVAAPVPSPASTPHRMRFMTFAIDDSGVRLVEGAMSAGRVKAPPQSTALRVIEFDAFADDGRRLYSGSIDHPRYRRFEYEDPKRPGQLASVTPSPEPDASFMLRWPAELPVSRLVLYDTSKLPPRRSVLADFALP